MDRPPGVIPVRYIWDVFQLAPLVDELLDSKLGVFADNRARPIHRWYPFVEGYSAEMVDLGLRLVRDKTPAVFDPFGGSGTTCLAAAERGLDSWFCEINPYLAWVAQTKVNAFQKARGDGEGLDELASRIEAGEPLAVADPDHPLLVTDDKRDFFPARVGFEVVGTLRIIDKCFDGPLRELARLGIGATLISCSNMIRRTDLRRRKENDPAPIAFRTAASKSLRRIAEDLNDRSVVVGGAAVQIDRDVRKAGPSANANKKFDLVVTSPPYLNGTNYFRNTKLELLALEFIKSESDLSPLRSESITAGINNVTKRRGRPSLIDEVEPIAERLDVEAYDQRIPSMVRLYFSDMQDALTSIRSVTADDGIFLLDIGDSRFSGVHVPTHELLSSIAMTCGWRHVETVHIRDRRSYDGTPLVQVLLLFSAR